MDTLSISERCPGGPWSNYVGKQQELPPYSGVEGKEHNSRVMLPLVRPARRARTVLGVHMKFDDVRVNDKVSQWNVRILEVRSHIRFDTTDTIYLLLILLIGCGCASTFDRSGLALQLQIVHVSNQFVGQDYTSFFWPTCKTTRRPQFFISGLVSSPRRHQSVGRAGTFVGTMFGPFFFVVSGCKAYGPMCPHVESPPSPRPRRPA